MKPGVSLDIRQSVMDLRRSYSLREVAARTGLPVGTVKTICSRSGAFRDNPRHRALFSLPPIRQSAQTLPAVVDVPEQRSVTGDLEIDAILWLREVISTGDAALIEKAMEAAKRIKTPLKEIENRYTKHLVSANPGNLFAALSSFDFGNLEDLARQSIRKRTLATEAEARFGDALFDDTEAETFCIECLRGIETGGFLDSDAEIDGRFMDRPEFLPHTLSDCLHELAYWNDLYRLRNAIERYACDGAPEASERDRFAFRCLARIRPRSAEEAISVFRYLADEEVDRMNWSETNSILLNLIGKGSAHELP